MRKLLLFALAGALATGANSQVLKVTGIEKIAVEPTEETALIAGFSPAGDYLLLTSPSKQGLVKYDLTTKATTTLTHAAGAGVATQISDDGKSVIFRERSVNADHLVFTAVKSLDMATLQSRELLAPTRELSAVAFDRNATAITVDKGKMKARALRGGNAVQSRPVIANVNLKLELTVDGQTTAFTPQGEEHNYIWASISPNGERVLYYVSGLGCFSCRLDQSDMRSLGNLHAPQWLDNETVVGMHDEDNGVYTTASAIIAMTLDGRQQRLTDDKLIAMYPYANADASKIAFSTPEGETYILSIAKQ